MKLDDNFSKQAVAAMRQAVNEALQKKQKLGQYAVTYSGKKVQRIEAQDITVNEESPNKQTD